MNHPLDNLTHGLLGAAVGMLRPREGGPPTDRPLTATDRAVPWATFVAAELPDMDIFFGRGPLDGFIWHRGFTHSLLLAPVLALLAAGAAKLVWRGARFSTLFGWSLGSILFAHLFNDWLTGWGTRLLWPFSEARLALDWLPIVDLLFTLPLLAGVILAWRRPGLRQRVITGLLAYLLLYSVGYRGGAHTLVARAVSQEYQGAPVAQMRVSPDLFNPTAWLWVVDLGDRYEQGRAYPFGPVKADTVVVKAAESPVVRAVQTAPELKPFFDQFSYPQIEYAQQPGGGYLVNLSDIRYRRAGMIYLVFLNSQLQVTEVRSGGW